MCRNEFPSTNCDPLIGIPGRCLRHRVGMENEPGRVLMFLLKQYALKVLRGA